MRFARQRRLFLHVRTSLWHKVTSPARGRKLQRSGERGGSRARWKRIILMRNFGLHYQKKPPRPVMRDLIIPVLIAELLVAVACFTAIMFIMVEL
jgi:hypothetical protein